MKQQQFLEVLDRDEAEARWRAVIDVETLPAESVALDHALGRVLAQDVRAEVDLNVIATGDGAIVEVQGGSEQEPIAAERYVELVAAGVTAVQQLLGSVRAQLS